MCIRDRVIAEAHLVGRSGVIAGMPPRLAAALGSPRGRGWAAALLALVLAAHHSATPSGPLVHGASALANTLVVAALIWWWHRRYAARPLPTPVSYTHTTLPPSDLVEILVVAVSLKKKKHK